MRSINFDDGLKTFAINGDKNKVIRFNPADLNIMVRAKEAYEKISEYQEQMGNVKLNPDGTPEEESEEALRILTGFEDLIRKETNRIFNSDVYDTIFSGQSPLCTVGNEKKFLFEAVYGALIPIIQEEVEVSSKAGRARVEKYTKGYAK